MIYDFFTDIFKYEKFPVEYECYKQFINSDVNYIAVPWTQILNSHWLDFPGRLTRDEYLRHLSKQKITQQNNFTVCQHDSYMLLRDYYKHLNITKVFACAAHDYDKIEGVEIIPMPYINTFKFNPIEKQILVSFIGSVTHECRNIIKQRIHNENIIFRDTYHITSDFFSSNNKSTQEQEYESVLSRSRFSLCPRGSNPNSVRFWESLAAGAIPILISDNYKLPNWDWDNTIIRLKESDLTSLNYSSLEKKLLDIKDEEIRRKNCLRAYDFFKQENYKRYITSYL
jgi:hypothetical protein